MNFPLFLSTIAIVVSLTATIFSIYKVVKLSEATHQEIEDAICQLLKVTGLLFVMILFATGAKGIAGLVSTSYIAEVILDAGYTITFIAVFVVGESAGICMFYSIYQDRTCVQG